MDIKRCTKSFRNAGRGCSVGDLVPATHPLAQAYPQFFEPVGDYVARLYPQYAEAVATPKADEDTPKEPAKKTAAPRTPRKPKA